MPTPSLSPFFFQAEDGIRDRDVTGVQTCALPISPVAQRLQEVIAVGNVRIDNGTRWATGGRAVFEQATRSEERRVGKECRSPWRAYDSKTKNKTATIDT